jgi:hypothetical protein
MCLLHRNLHGPHSFSGRSGEETYPLFWPENKSANKMPYDRNMSSGRGLQTDSTAQPSPTLTDTGSQFHGDKATGT